MNIFNKKRSAILLGATLLSLSIMTLTTQDINYKIKQSNNDLISIASFVGPVDNSELIVEKEIKQIKAVNVETPNVEEYVLIADNKPIRLHNEKLSTSRGYINAQRAIEDDLSNEQVARLVIGGKYGNGNTRKLSIENQGYNYDEIQKEVAKLLETSSDKNISISSALSKPITNTKSTPTESNRIEETMEAEQVIDVEQTAESSTHTMQASAYSTQQKNLSRYTADGTDLIKNPRVVAVDPKVIPLGTKVEIEGYGTYIAADTGGAIKGNRIDIHFQTVKECFDFGRRDVKVTIYK